MAGFNEHFTSLSLVFVLNLDKNSAQQGWDFARSVGGQVTPQEASHRSLQDGCTRLGVWPQLHMLCHLIRHSSPEMGDIPIGRRFRLTRFPWLMHQCEAELLSQKGRTYWQDCFLSPSLTNPLLTNIYLKFSLNSHYTQGTFRASHSL